MVNKMLGNVRENEKLKELVELANMTEKQLENANYKQKQAHYRAKSKLCKIFFISQDKKGNGMTYIKDRK